MSGVRNSKTVGGVTYEFTTLSGKLMRQTWQGNELQFVYDASNRPYMMLYTPSGGTAQTYYYVLNIQGDVVGLLNASGSMVVHYTYDPWGKPTGTTASNAYATIAEANPLRYRGYYFDSETGFYYLQSRYYDPNISRFINADSYVTTDIDGLLSGNMFAYCENNPIMCSDPDGELLITAIVVGVVAGAVIGGAVGGTIAYNSAKSSGLEGSDLFWATVDGTAKGAVIGGVAGGLAGTTVGATVVYGSTSIAGTATITASATITARAFEVGGLQTKKALMMTIMGGKLQMIAWMLFFAMAAILSHLPLLKQVPPESNIKSQEFQSIE